jgi:hypothetical protein
LTRFQRLITYRDLQDELVAVVVGRQGVQNRGKRVGIEFHCIHASDITSSKAIEPLGAGFRRVLGAGKRFSCYPSPSFCQAVNIKRVRYIPSTTAPMTWWILPTRPESELANLAESAGRALDRRGSKARRATGVGRAKAALPKVRARPLERKIC